MNREEDFVTAWEPGNVVRYPKLQWLSALGAPEDSYPEIDFLPIELSVVYTTRVGGEFKLYDRVNVEAKPGDILSLIVIGAVPSAPESMLFCLDAASGRVALLGVEQGTLEVVNSSLRMLVEFLYHFARFIDEDTGLATRPQRALELRRIFERLDPEALTQPDSWWSMVLAQLGAGVPTS